MTAYEPTDRLLDRARRGDASTAEIEEGIAATRADLDRNLGEIEQRFSPEQLVNQAVGYLREGPGEFFDNLGATVKANPVPVALLSVSLGWLIFAGRRSRRAGAADRRAFYGVEERNDADWAEAGDYRYQPEDADQSRLQNVADTVREVRERMEDRGEAIGERVADLSDRAASYGNDLRDRVSKVGSSIGESGRRVGQRTQTMFHTARDGLAHAGEFLSEQPKRFRAGYGNLAEHHPFILGTAAFAVGAALAAGLPRTRVEDEVVGDLSDRTVAEARARARAELQEGVDALRSVTAQTADGATGDGAEEDSVDDAAGKAPAVSGESNDHDNAQSSPTDQRVN